MSTARSAGIAEVPASFSQVDASGRQRATRAGANLLLLGLWLRLYQPVFAYLAVIFTREDFRVNQWALLGIIALGAWRARRAGLTLRLDAPPAPHLPALFVAVGGSLFYLAAERYLDVNTLSASLFVLSSYGLLGLWLAPPRWRQGAPVALLFVAVLPFGDHLQTFVGYPMRLVTASLVRDGLQALGIASVGLDTILVFENGVSQVDLPCSGVKSLWVGLLFLLAATWIERRPLGPRWVLTALAMGTLLFLANLARVAVLVVVGPVLGARLAAELIHVPLGVVGFCVAAAGTVLLLPPRRLPSPSGEPPALPSPPRHPAWLAPALAAMTLALALAYSPRLPAPPVRAAEFRLPDQMVTRPLPLDEDAAAWLASDGAESADRHQFQWRGLSGSLLLVTSASWRAQHLPERCLQVLGLSLDDSRTYLAAPHFPLRLVSLGGRQGTERRSVAYWFQSATRTTDDYATRIWADLAPQHDRWVLVTVLFDGAPDPAAPDVQALFEALHTTIGRSLAPDAHDRESNHDEGVVP